MCLGQDIGILNRGIFKRNKRELSEKSRMSFVLKFASKTSIL